MQLRFFLRWQEKAVAKKAFLNLRRQNGSLRRQKNAEASMANKTDSKLFILSHKK